MGGYAADHRRSLEDPDGFWRERLRAVDWFTRPRVLLDPEAPAAGRWFPDGILNLCYNALDRHVIRGRADEPALVFHSVRSGTRRTSSYADLLQEVAQLGGGLRELGVEPGDRVLLLMPMVPEAVVALLACARLGAVPTLVPGGPPADELATRIDDARPTVVLLSSCGWGPGGIEEYKPLLDAALQAGTHRPDYVVVHQRPEVRAVLGGERELDLALLMRPGQFQPAGCAELAATHPVSLHHAPGNTGGLRRVLQDHGGLAVGLTSAVRSVHDLGPDDGMVIATGAAWGVGHPSVVYAPLLVGGTTVLYEGEPVGTPDAGSFWRLVSEHRATVLLTSPSAVEAIRREDPDAELVRRHDLTSLRTLVLTGEPPDPGARRWAGEQLGVPVVDQWWPSGTGVPVAASPRGLDPRPLSAGSATVPLPGFDVRALGPDGTVLPPGQEGELCLRLPLPPGTRSTVEDDVDPFPGWSASGDRGFLDADGSVVVTASPARVGA